MTRGQREPDYIGHALKRILNVSIRKLKFELLTEIKNSYDFKKLISLSHGATQEDSERLANALLDARINHIRIIPIIDAYAQKFIYPHRKRTR